ncbi:anti-sigma-I factor RsgI isoform X2 [Cricetulus griseus]|uniref:Anti-sigma-I factor RsgI isoform X2 n=1 Tax=Cricetulus griseus TaxID=10029 RepID=A0A9J7K0P1_CRIGR|nr:anti-sigma-I factor RsgI isoform X2 [Cricetulus griseus]XP_027285660.1 anti-sigma-I factor RsgI isoform X2 [Cricetulus griseus]
MRRGWMCILDLKYLLRSNPKWQSRPKSTPQDLILTKKQESKSSWYCSQEICADVSGCKVLLKALVFPGVARGCADGCVASRNRDTMAASKLLLVLLSMALLALTSAQTAKEDDENSLQGQQSHEDGDSSESGELGIQEMKNQVKEQISQHGKKAENFLKGNEKRSKGKGRGGNRGSDGESLRGQDRQSGNQQGRGGQGGQGRGGQRGEKGQSAKGGQKVQRGKGGKKNQQVNVGEFSEE